MSRPNVWAGKTCIAPECDEAVKCRGLCKKHYTRVLRGESLEGKGKRSSHNEVQREARAGAVLDLIGAHVIPKTADPVVVALAVGIEVADLQRALAGRQRRRAALNGSPRANVDRRAAPMGTKWCSMCKAFIKTENFHRDKNSVDGLGHICKPCKRTYQMTYRRRGRTA